MNASSPSNFLPSREALKDHMLVKFHRETFRLIFPETTTLLFLLCTNKFSSWSTSHWNWQLGIYSSPIWVKNRGLKQKRLIKKPANKQIRCDFLFFFFFLFFSFCGRILSIRFFFATEFYPTLTGLNRTRDEVLLRGGKLFNRLDYELEISIAW